MSSTETGALSFSEEPYPYNEFLARCDQDIDKDEYIKAVERWKRVDKSSHVILTVAPAFSLTAAILCLLMIFLLIFAIVKRRIPNKKYSVVVSRTIADLFISFLVGGASLMANHHSASYAVLALFLCVATFGFVQLSLSHLLVIVLRQISLCRPYGLDSAFSTRRLIAATVASWLMAILYSAAFSPLTTVILSPEKADNICSFKKCAKPLLVIAICLIGFLLVTVMIFYAVVTYNLRKASIEERMHNEPNVSRKKLNKFLAFGGHIALYALIGALLMAGAIITLHNAWLYNKLKEEETCQLVEYLNTVIRLETIAGGALLLWSVRIVSDCVILLLTEYRRVIPWIAARSGPQILRNHHVLQRSESLRWHRASRPNYPVYTLDKPNKWEFKN